MAAILCASTKSSDDSEVRNILRGLEHLVSFPGRSQYTPDGETGISACGLAALNCARTILNLEQKGIQGARLLQEMLRLETFEVSLLFRLIKH